MFSELSSYGIPSFLMLAFSPSLSLHSYFLDRDLG